MAEQQLRRALSIAQGDITTLVQSPVAAGLLLLAALALIVLIILRARGSGADGRGRGLTRRALQSAHGWHSAAAVVPALHGVHLCHGAQKPRKADFG
jgi:hypothetical protein